MPWWFDRLERIAAVAPPLDLQRCSDNMNRWVLRPYNYYFIKALLERAPTRVRQREAFQQELRGPRPRTLRELDDRYTAPMSGFEDACDYYAKSSCNQVTPHNPVPTLVLAAADDPIVPIGCFVDDPKVWSDTTELLITKTGGHVGFIDREKRSWMDQALAAWFDFSSRDSVWRAVAGARPNKRPSSEVSASNGPVIGAVFRGPDRGRLDFIGHRRALVGTTASFQSTDQLDGHVGIAGDLTAQPDAWLGDPTSTQRFLLGLGHLVGFALDELDATGRASRIPATRMQLVGLGVVDECLDEPRACATSNSPTPCTVNLGMILPGSSSRDERRKDKAIRWHSHPSADQSGCGGCGTLVTSELASDVESSIGESSRAVLPCGFPLCLQTQFHHLQFLLGKFLVQEQQVQGIGGRVALGRQFLSQRPCSRAVGRVDVRRRPHPIPASAGFLREPPWRCQVALAHEPKQDDRRRPGLRTPRLARIDTRFPATALSQIQRRLRLRAIVIAGSRPERSCCRSNRYDSGIDSFDQPFHSHHFGLPLHAFISNS